MAQFDVYANPSKASRKHYPFLLDIQNPYISDLATRIVIPLGKASSFGSKAMKGLTPEVTFDNEDLLLLTPQISSVPANKLKSPVGSLEHFRNEILNALDFAVAGI